MVRCGTTGNLIAVDVKQMERILDQTLEEFISSHRRALRQEGDLRVISVLFNQIKSLGLVLLRDSVLCQQPSTVPDSKCTSPVHT